MRISDWSSDVCSSDLLRVIDAGNYIGAGDANGIAVITQVTPIDVVFNVPQDRVGEIRARADQGRSEERRGGKECVRTGRSRWRQYHDKKEQYDRRTDNETYHSNGKIILEETKK